jgi:5,5'-dehydrodivanillate O-demethylase
MAAKHRDRRWGGKMSVEPKDVAHTGPGTLAGRFLRRFWHPVFRSDDLKIGRPQRIQVMSEYFTLYRGDSGTAYLVDDRCPHRQTSLFIGWVKGETIRCFYHGWTFDGAGQCIEQPAESGVATGRMHIGAYPLREYLGLIFAYLGEGEPPAFPVYPEIENTDGNGQLVVARYPVPCNFFQRYENDLDEVHVHFVHSVSTEKVGLTEIPDVQVEETEYGIRREGVRTGGGDNYHLVGHHMMPNISMVDLVPSPEFPYRTFQVAWRVPLDDETMMTCSIGLRRLDPDFAALGKVRPAVKVDPDPMTLTQDILAGKLRIQDVDPTYPALFILQDNVVLAAQGRITDRANDKLGRSDKGIILLRRIWERELAALDEGRPLKEWRRPADALALTFTQLEPAAGE